MVRCLVGNTQETRHRYCLLHALYICEKKLARFAIAFKYLKKANDLRRSYINYDPKRDERDIGLIKKKFVKVANTSNPSADGSNNRYVFIVGMPRSGTTLVEQTICNAKGVVSIGETASVSQFMTKVDLNTDPELIVNDLATFYCAEINKHNFQEHYLIDKTPRNLFWVGFLALSFPNAQFIHCKRDARATCWSNYETSFAEGNFYSFKLDETVRHYNYCEDLMIFWKSKFHDRIFTLDYDAFTEEPEIIGRNLFDFLRLPWKQEYLDNRKSKRPVKTASKLQVKKGIYRGSSQVWKNFEPFIGKAFQQLID